MSETNKKEEVDVSGPPALDIAAIGKVVREELDRQNKYLEFAQGQIETDRKFDKHLYTYAVGFLAFMVIVAGYFQYTSVSQMRSDMKASVDAEIDRDKAEIAALRAQALEASAEAQATVNRELANVRTEVQKGSIPNFKVIIFAVLLPLRPRSALSNN